MELFYPFELACLAVAGVIVMGRRLVRKILRWREVAMWRKEVRNLPRLNGAAQAAPWLGSAGQAILGSQGAWPMSQTSISELTRAQYPKWNGNVHQRRRPAELDDPDRRK